MKNTNVLVIVLLVLTLCNCGNNYDYPPTTFLESETPFEDEVFNYCNNNFNFMDYVVIPSFEKDSILNVLSFTINGSDTTIKNRTNFKYIAEKKILKISTSNSYSSWIITYNEDNKIESIKKGISVIEFCYDGDKLIQINRFYRKSFLCGYCKFEYNNNRLVKELWYDVFGENAKEELNRTVLYIYNDDNDLIQKNIYNSEGTVVRTIRYEYGKVIDKVKDIFFFSRQDSIVAICHYDKMKRLVAKRFSKSDVVDSLVYKTTPYGFDVEESTYISNKRIDDFLKIKRYN